MSETERAKKANYGIDAPRELRRFIIIALLGLTAGISLPRLFPHQPFLVGISKAGIWIGTSFLITVAIMLWGSLVGKMRLRDRVLNLLNWRGDEVVLDVGCGHGLMLIGAAKRLKTGKAIGVDLWQQEDQYSNTAAATLENARCEGVSERVEIRDGDARALPFPDQTFDIIVSSWAIHNIYDQTERKKAIREIARVLKPGGQLAIIDIQHSAEYLNLFREFGLSKVDRKGPSFIFVTPTYTVIGTK